MAAQIVTLNAELIHTLSLTPETLEAAGLHQNSPLSVSVENGRIILNLADPIDALYGSFPSDIDLVAELQEERRQDRW